MDNSTSEAATPRPPDPTTKRIEKRTWTRSLWLHALLLGCVLVALLPVIGFQAVYSADEGAALSQAKQLRDHGTWFIPNSFPQVDPDGRAAAITKSTLSRKGFAPLLKHPTYIYLLVGAEAIAGSSGPLLLGILGTVMAAIAAAMLTRERAEQLTLWALWLTGIATPLLFDSYMILAHTVAAAGTGFAAVGLVKLRRDRRLSSAVLAAAGIGFAVLMRSEALLFGIALGGVAALLALRGGIRPIRATVRRLVPTAVVVGASSVAYFIDRLVTIHLAAQSHPMPVPATSSAGYVADRISAFTVTWLAPGHDAGLQAGLPAFLAVITIATVISVRRSSGDLGLLRFGIVGMCVIGAAWVKFDRIAVVPGILCAFPLLAAGLAAWRRKFMRSSVAALLAGTSLVFALAVLLTEYARGGSVEWGARYLAVGIPAVVPLILWALDDLRLRLPAVGRRWMAIGLVPLVVAPAVGSVTFLGAIHKTGAAVVDAVATAAASTTPGDGGKPVVVTNELQFPRLAWDKIGDGRWFAASKAEMPGVERRLAVNGIKQFLFVTYGSGRPIYPHYVLRNCRPAGLHGSAWVVCDADLR